MALSPLVENAAGGELFFEGFNRVLWEERDAVLRALAAADDDLAVAEVDVLDPESETFHEAQAGSVEEESHQMPWGRQLADDLPGLLRGEDHRDTIPGLGEGEGVEPTWVDIEHLLVEEDQGVEGLILRCGRDVKFHCEMAEERADFQRAHLVRVPFLVVENKAADPVHISFLGSEAVMSHAERGTHAIQ
jgi:hypothetical protein